MDLESTLKPKFIFLMEIKVGRVHVDKLKAKLGFEGCVFIDTVGMGGGIGLL